MFRHSETDRQASPSARHSPQDRQCPAHRAHQQLDPQPSQPPTRGHDHASCRAGAGQRGRDGRVGLVQQPCHGERCAHVDSGHSGGGLVPGVAVAGGRHGAGGTGVGRRVPVPVGRPGESQMERTLHGQRASDRGQRGETTAGGGPDTRELQDHKGGHEAPRLCRAAGRMVAEGGEDAARHGEDSRPGTGARRVRPLSLSPLREGHAGALSHVYPLAGSTVSGASAHPVMVRVRRRIPQRSLSWPAVPPARRPHRRPSPADVLASPHLTCFA